MSSFSTNRHPLCPPFIKFKRSPKYTLPEIITIPSEDFQLPEYPTIDTSYETQMLEKYEHLKKEMEAETVMLESLAKEIQHKKSMGHLESAMHHVTLPKPMDLSEFETPADPWNLPTVTNVHEDLQQLQSSLPSYVTSSPYPNLHVSPMPTPRPGPSPPLTETTHQRALAMGFPIPAIELAIQLYHDDFKKVTEFCILYPTLLQGCSHFDLVMATPKLGKNETWETYAKRLRLFSHFCEMGFEPPKVVHALLMADFQEEKALEQLGLT